jgi:putative endonuclease
MLGRLFDWFRHAARRRTWTAEHALGRRGEDLAHRFLRGQGYVIVARNHRLAGGEADIIAWDRETLVVVEVKSRSNADFGSPERAIDQHKREQLRRIARRYAYKAGVEAEGVRFDLVTVLFTRPPQLELLRDAL